METKLDKRSAESRGQRFEWIRRANGRNGRAIKRFFSGTNEPHGLSVRDTAILHDAELQGYAAAIAEHRRFRHHRIPVPPNGGNHARHVIGAIHPLRGSKNFISSSLTGAPTSLRPPSS